MIPNGLQIRTQTTTECTATITLVEHMTIELLVGILDECVLGGVPRNADVDIRVSKIDGTTTLRAYSQVDAPSPQPAMPLVEDVS